MLSECKVNKIYSFLSPYLTFLFSFVLTPLMRPRSSTSSRRKALGKTSGSGENRKEERSTAKPLPSKCLQCGRKDHRAEHCKESKPLCFACGKPGHKRAQCRARNAMRAAPGARPQQQQHGNSTAAQRAKPHATPIAQQQRAPRNRKQQQGRKERTTEPAPAAQNEGSTTTPNKWLLTLSKSEVPMTLLRTPHEKEAAQEIMRLLNVAACSEIAHVKQGLKLEQLYDKDQHQTRTVKIFSRVTGESVLHKLPGRFRMAIEETHLRQSMLHSDVTMACERATQLFAQLLHGHHTIPMTKVQAHDAIPSIEIFPEYARETVKQWAAHKNTGSQLSQRSVEDIMNLTIWFVGVREKLVTITDAASELLRSNAAKRAQRWRDKQSQRAQSSAQDAAATNSEQHAQTGNNLPAGGNASLEQDSRQVEVAGTQQQLEQLVEGMDADDVETNDPQEADTERTAMQPSLTLEETRQMALAFMQPTAQPAQTNTPLPQMSKAAPAKPRNKEKERACSPKRDRSGSAIPANTAERAAKDALRTADSFERAGSPKKQRTYSVFKMALSQPLPQGHVTTPTPTSSTGTSHAKAPAHPGGKAPGAPAEQH